VVLGSKPLSSRHLEVISAAPENLQLTLAEMAYKEKLTPSELERAREAVMRGVSAEDAVKQAKKPVEEHFKRSTWKRTSPETSPLQPVKPPEGTFEAALTEVYTCPKCGAKLEVNWVERKAKWL